MTSARRNDSSCAQRPGGSRSVTTPVVRTNATLINLSTTTLLQLLAAKGSHWVAGVSWQNGLGEVFAAASRAVVTAGW